jgi:hypothetical protein
MLDSTSQFVTRSKVLPAATVLKHATCNPGKTILKGRVSDGTVLNLTSIASQTPRDGRQDRDSQTRCVCGYGHHDLQPIGRRHHLRSIQRDPTGRIERRTGDEEQDPIARPRSIARLTVSSSIQLYKREKETYPISLVSFCDASSLFRQGQGMIHDSHFRRTSLSVHLSIYIL